ncbi:hypothetical protein PspLS_04054 [Pyricularia sp. CBS 133598]|nr:hypothetical protein PspLS_04054 [Pyricularia sp. CBS 133598]
MSLAVNATDPAAAAAQAAAAAAAAEGFHRFTIELWTLFTIGALTTILRTYARVKANGFANLRADDYLVWVGLIGYASQCSLGYSIGNVAKGFANNGMTPEERANLDPNGPEYGFRIIGSQIQIAGWTMYSTLIWSLKLSMLFFYMRLVEGLGRRYRVRIYVGFFLVIATFLSTILTIFLGCRPFRKYWQISPDPGNQCQPAVSDPIVWSSFAANVATDIYLIAIPLPLLWGSTLRLGKKIASTIVLGAGIFVLVCAILKTIYVLVDPLDGAQLAGQWGTREAFTAVMTTNLPMIFPLIRQILRPYLPTALRSTKKEYKTPEGRGAGGNNVRTIGGGARTGDLETGASSTVGGSGGSRTNAYAKSRSAARDSGANFHHMGTSTLTFTESEERIVDDHDIKLRGIKRSAERGRGELVPPERGIVVSNEVEVRSEHRTSQDKDIPGGQRVHEHW